MNGGRSSAPGGRRAGATPPNSLVVRPTNGRAPNQDDDLYRDPTLPEVIDYLSCHDEKLEANAGAYLQVSHRVSFFLLPVLFSLVLMLFL